MHVFFDFEQAMKVSKDGAFMISYSGILFPFKWKLTDSDKLVVFLPGRTARERPVPSFQRSSYFTDLAVNCVSCFDPTLFLSPTLVLGWFQGKRNISYANIVGKLIHQMVTTLKLHGKDVLIYGTSGGGIPGFNIAAAIEQSTLYVCNVQTDVSQYFPRFYRSMAAVSYPGEKLVDLPAKYGERLSIHHINAPFNLIYSQNLEDQFHYDNHFLAYARHRAPREKILSSKLITYTEKESGHGPLPRETELAIIRHLLQKKDPIKLFPQGEYFDYSDA